MKRSHTLLVGSKERACMPILTKGVAWARHLGLPTFTYTPKNMRRAERHEKAVPSNAQSSSRLYVTYAMRLKKKTWGGGAWNGRRKEKGGGTLGLYDSVQV